MSEGLSIDQIKSRVISSFLSLTARQVLLRTISFVSLNLILARVLPVETIGLFNLANGVITFFAYFSDVGLAASLIQKKSAITESDIKTVFSIQSLIVGILSLLIIVFAPNIGGFYQLNNEGIWLIRILGIGFFLSSLKVVPAVLLERELRFRPLVTVELIETLVFNCLLIYLALNNYGIWSFSWAALARGIVGTILIYLVTRTKVRLGFDRLSAKQLLQFGVPFQLNSLLALLKDRLVPLVVARMIGTIGVGYITWAQNLAYLPLELMSVMIRITFPAFARLQDDRQNLSKAVEKSLFVTTFLTYPLIFGIAAILPALVAHVVSSKWQPAIWTYYLFAFATLWSVVSTTLTNTLNSVGQVKTTLKLMVMWTTLEWSLTPLLVYYFGFNGVGMAAFIISFSSLVTIFIVKRFIDVSIWRAIGWPLLMALAMGLIVAGFSWWWVREAWMVWIAIGLGGLLYGLLAWILIGNRLKQELALIRSLRHG